MDLSYSEVLSFVVWGELGLFTKPAFRADRVTQPMMPPSAAEGLVKSVFWHPEADTKSGEPSRLGVEVSEIHVLNRIHTVRMRTNEVETLSKKDSPLDVTQRQTSLVLLKDPKYLVKARYVSPSSQIAKKSAEIFKRRLSKGQSFRQPCMGRRRYPAFFREATPEDKALPIDMDLGFFPWRIEYDTQQGRTRKVLHTFPAQLQAGVLRVPSWFESRIQQGEEVSL